MHGHLGLHIQNYIAHPSPLWFMYATISRLIKLLTHGLFYLVCCDGILKADAVLSALSNVSNGAKPLRGRFISFW